MPMCLKNRCVNGLKWSTIQYISLFILQFFQLSILARLLTPTDFGIFAIGTFFTTLGNSVFALGVGPALIQKQEDIVPYLNTAWTSNLIISIFATFFLLIISPHLVVSIFKNESAILPAYTMISVVLISGFNNIGIVLYLKEIQLKLIFIYQVLPKFFAILSMVGLAIYLKSYWALVVGIVFEYILKCIISYYIIPFRPKFEFNKEKFKELYFFGGWLQLKNILNWLAGYIDVAFVGGLLRTEVLGFYNRSQAMAKLPQTQITSIVNSVSFPLYSQIIKEKKQLQKSLNATNDLVLVIICPIIAVVILFGKHIVAIVLGSQWLYLSDAFRLLVVSFSIESYLFSFFPLLRASGFPKFEFLFQALKILILSILIYPLTIKYGIFGTSLAVFLSSLSVAPFILYKICLVTKLSFRVVFESLFVCLCCVTIICWFLPLVDENNLSLVYTIIGVTLNLIVFFGFLILGDLFFQKGPGGNLIHYLTAGFRHFRLKICRF